MPRIGVKTKGVTAARSAHTTPARPRASKQTRQSAISRLKAKGASDLVNVLAKSLQNASLNASVAQNASPLPITSTPTAQQSQPVNAIQRYDFGDSVSTPTQSKRYFGLLCATFGGNTSPDGIEVTEWLPIFERLTRSLTDDDRITALSRHLTDDALKWYAVDRMFNETDWNVVRNAFLRRFTRAKTIGITEASERRLKVNETVETYYNDMRRILLHAEQTDKCQVEFLTKGMPESYRLHIATIRPKTPQEWLEIAIALEEVKRKRFTKFNESSHFGEEDHNTEPKTRIKKQFKDRNDKRFKGNYTRTQPNSELPAEPCPRCLKQYGLREYHWKRLCPRTEPQTTQASTPLPVITSNAVVRHSGHSTNLVTNADFIFYDIRINDKKIRGFLDSGSTLSAISSSAAKRLNLKPDPRTAITIRHIDGNAKTLGRVEPIVRLNGKTLRFSMHVFERLTHDALLGIDAMKAFMLTADYRLLPKVNTCSEPSIFNATFILTNDSIDSFLEHFEVFAKDDKDIGRIGSAQHVIRLKPDAQPFHIRPFRVSPEREKQMRKHTDDLLSRGFIRPSRSPYASPMFLVPKANKELRPVIDFRRLNSQTIGEREPLPIIRDLIDKLSGSTIFSTLDVAWGYWHLPLHPDSIEKTAFVTPYGQFEWTVLPMGLKNATSVFQRELRNVLREFIGKGVELYLDDIVVHSSNEAEHRSLLKNVFTCLQDVGIRLRRNKCTFIAKEIEFLGHVISENVVRPSPRKTRAVKEFPAPTTVKQVQEFVGLANFYRSFISNFSRLAEPLTRLSRKDTPFEWSDRQQTAFDELKNALCDSPVLSIYDPKKPLILQTDGSALGLGAQLMQRDDNDCLHPIAYWSQKLTDTESRYSAPEFECLAVVLAVEHFRVYLEGTHFDIYSDCAALRWLFAIPNPSSRLYRWSVRLGAYDYTVHHRPGRDNKVADAFSRNPVVNTIDNDSFIQRQDEIKTYCLRKSKVVNGRAVVHYNGYDRTVVPPSLVADVLRHFHDDAGHPGTQKTRTVIASRYWWPTRDRDIKQYVKSCHSCQSVKPPNERRIGTLRPIETPDKPNELWAIDTIVMGTAANASASKYIMTVVDHHSRFVWASAVKKNTASAAINVLSKAFDTVGPPKALLHDNGTNYTSKELRKFLDNNGIKQLVVPPYRPQGNGLVEKCNDTIVKGIRLALTDNTKIRWSSALKSVVSSINKMPHRITGFTPRYVHFGLTDENGLQTTVTIEEARRLTTQRSRDAQINRKQKHDANHVKSSFRIGDLVKWRLPDNHPSRNKLTPYFIAPCEVIEIIGEETYRIKQLDVRDDLTIRSFIAHSSALFPYFRRNITTSNRLIDETTEEINQNNEIDDNLDRSELAGIFPPGN